MESKFVSIMSEELNALQKSIEENRKIIQKLPHGTLSCYKDGKFFKWVENKTVIDEDGNSNRIRKYIPKSQEDHAFKLAYRTYLEKKIKDEEKELNAITSYLKRTTDKSLSEIYMKRNPELTRLLYPYTNKWDINAEKWRQQKTEIENTIPVEHPLITKAGEIVRSKGELIICDRLYDRGIPYKVEQAFNVSKAFQIIDELRIPYNGKRYNYLFPDITILDKNKGEIIWEHMGLCSDPKYMRHNCDKILLYSLLGYIPFNNFIITFEDESKYIDTIWIDRIINYYLEH